MNHVPPPGTPKRIRLSLVLLRFLTFHNRLDGLIAFFAVWWGAWTLVFDDFWMKWPVAKILEFRMWGYPETLGWCLLVSGILGYFGKVYGLTWLRTMCFLTMFACWGVLTLAFYTLEPMFSPGVACYSALAISTLISYISFQVGLEKVNPRDR